MYLLSFSISLIGLLFLIFNTVLFVKDNAVRQKVSKVFVWYLIALSITEIACHVIGFLKPNTNFFLSHFYFNIQFIFLSLLFYKLFSEGWIKRLVIIIFILQQLILISTYILKPSLFWEFNVYEIVSTSVILVLYALLFIYRNMERMHTYFNFSIGLIMYLLCSILIFVSGNTELVFFKEPYIDIWVFNSIFYIFFQYMIFREYKAFKKLK